MFSQCAGADPARRGGLRLRYQRPRAAHVLPLSGRQTRQRYGVIEDLYATWTAWSGRRCSMWMPRTALFVLSDHGFCRFRRGVNLNSWLHQNGYLALQDGATGERPIISKASTGAARGHIRSGWAACISICGVARRRAS